MNKPRLSMKLLWQLRDEFLEDDRGKWKKEELSITKIFLWWVEDYYKTPHATQPLSKRPKTVNGDQERDK